MISNGGKPQPNVAGPANQPRLLFPCTRHTRYKPTWAPRWHCAQCRRIWKHRDAILFGIEVLKAERARRN